MPFIYLAHRGITEIGEVIKERLFAWFEAGSSNQANVPLPKLTPENIEALLKNRQYSAEQARAEGRLENLENIEKSIEETNQSFNQQSSVKHYRRIIV